MVRLRRGAAEAADLCRVGAGGRRPRRAPTRPRADDGPGHDRDCPPGYRTWRPLRRAAARAPPAFSGGVTDFMTPPFAPKAYCGVPSGDGADRAPAVFWEWHQAPRPGRYLSPVVIRCPISSFWRLRVKFRVELAYIGASCTGLLSRLSQSLLALQLRPRRFQSAQRVQFLNSTAVKRAKRQYPAARCGPALRLTRRATNRPLHDGGINPQGEERLRLLPGGHEQADGGRPPRLVSGVHVDTVAAPSFKISRRAAAESRRRRPR